jgi:arsenate reductase
MKKVTIWHNPRCSKSRETLALLQDRNIELDVVDYLRTPPTAAQLAEALALLALEPREFMRTSESVYREQRLDDPSLTRAQLIAAMHEHPILIQRPVVFANDNARIGRPPEAVLEIL